MPRLRILKNGNIEWANKPRIPVSVVQSYDVLYATSTKTGHSREDALTKEKNVRQVTFRHPFEAQTDVPNLVALRRLLVYLGDDTSM